MDTNERQSWDEFYMGMARYVSKRSRDPSTKVGAVVVDKHHRVSIGYNDFPKGVEHSLLRYTNKETKYKIIVHAEVNAILKAGDYARGATIYTTLFPCCDCAGHIINSGITRVVYPKYMKWGADDYGTCDTMLTEAGILVKEL